ncbi:hypothetical protein [Flavobacterium psychrophilum]|uniref:Uncharacterized protein n=1 Tax=Flavobacterium psychrophilum TaxID=96345 RepID=A0A7U2NEI6_FLAPS|nr:hypothetical protein [Flavobacterium psychrophilum]QRE03478.1 hypothetical protein H0H26_11395 [Flavobacterium psychrophilum]
MVDSLEIIKGSFFKNKKGKVVEIYGFTVENEKLSIWTRESYLNSKNEIQHHQELYFIEDINHIEVDNDWLEEFGFKKQITQYYELFKNDEYFLTYDFENKKLGVFINNTRGKMYWIDCNFVNKLQTLIPLLAQTT